MFARHFHDNLHGFADAFVDTAAAGDAATMPGAQLCRSDTLAGLIDRFAADRGSADRRATASQWSKWFFSRLIIPTTVVQLATARRLAVPLSSLGIRWHPDATPARFVLPDNAFAAGAGHDLSTLIDDALMPLVDALAGQCRLSPRVFWSNAATYYDWVVDELGRQGRIPAERIARAAALRDCKDRPDGGFNPFAQCTKACAPGALDGNGEPTHCCRRMCCMRDLDAKWGLCANCPRAVHYGDERRPLARA